jgi:hypothetical protein
MTALNGLSADVQTISTGTTGTDFNVVSSGTDHQFNLPTASATTRGALSTTDWSAFNGKQATLVSGTNIKTINGNSILGSGNLTISGSNIYTADGTLTAARTLTQGGFDLTIAGTTSSRFFSNGNVGIGTTTNAGFKLDVNGTARFSGAVTAGSNNGTFGGVILDFNSGTRRIRPEANTIDLTSTAGAIAFSFGGTPNVASGYDSFSFVRNLNNFTYAGLSSSQTMTLNLNGARQGHLTPFVDIVANGYSANAPAPKNSTLRIYTTNTTSGIYGNILLSWNGTAKTGNIIVGGATDDASALLNVQSTTQGFLPPRMTTTQKNAIASPAAGLVVYDTTLNKLCVRTASAWETITSV